MKIPPKEILELAIKQALKNSKAESQHRLAALVSKRLKEFDAAYTISGRRARQAAADLKEIKITTHTKTGALPQQCPCCQSRLKKHYTKNLMGKKILLKLHCPKCGYAGSGKQWAPRTYTFVYRG